MCVIQCVHREEQLSTDPTVHIGRPYQVWLEKILIYPKYQVWNRQNVLKEAVEFH